MLHSKALLYTVVPRRLNLPRHHFQRNKDVCLRHCLQDAEQLGIRSFRPNKRIHVKQRFQSPPANVTTATWWNLRRILSCFQWSSTITRSMERRPCPPLGS